MAKKFDLTVSVPKIKVLNHFTKDGKEARKLECELNKIYKDLMNDFTKQTKILLKDRGF